MRMLPHLVAPAFAIAAVVAAAAAVLVETPLQALALAIDAAVFGGVAIILFGDDDG